MTYHLNQVDRLPPNARLARMISCPSTLSTKAAIEMPALVESTIDMAK